MRAGQRAYREERRGGAAAVVDAIRRHVILNDRVVVVVLPGVVPVLEDGARVAETRPFRDRLPERTEVARRMPVRGFLLTGM